MTEKIALIAAIALPFWNIPLIARMIKRRSSADISLHWALGVWICFILMAPEAFKSSDLVWKTFNIVNLALFSLVIAVILYYRQKKFSPKN
ncbi:MAG: hypothetical protein K9L84_04125 [Candidatus Omnitrophica bacterium]|nr:hypothetical protein [Candidatus Omnitrophota bacterium]MCF7894228.1 hypothetical protein [Candidatus Omnitrophota bacterium]